MSKKAKQPRFAVIDAETDPFRIGRIGIRPFLWGFFDGATYRQFDKTEDLADAVADFDGVVYAHNGGKFDFHFLLDFFESDTEIMIINGRIGRVEFGKAELRDSWLIIPVPLGAYKKDVIDYSIMEAGERDKPENRRKIEEYLKADCIYLYEIVARFIADYGLCLTQAGSAMKEWKRIAPIAPAETNREFYEHFAPYYFGGRVECFERGIIKTAFSVYDINSAYPFAMMEAHPYSENYSETAGYVEGADFYKLRCRSMGAFPYRDGDTLAFPRDGQIREFHVSKWEYNAAIDTDTLRDCEILQSIRFMGHMDFSVFIEKFYSLRMTAKEVGDEAGTLLYKLTMNSLYGKFAANPENYKNYMIVEPRAMYAYQSQGWQHGGMLGDWALAQCDLTDEQSHYYNVATGASITGYVRAMLWRAICGSERVLYCDTDSLAIAGYADIDEGKKLGQWKHEGDFDRAGIAGKKLYIFRGIDGTPDKYASKGVRLTTAELWRVARGETVRYQSEAPTFSVRMPPRQIARNVRITGA